MEISGINNNSGMNTIGVARSKAMGDSFESRLNSALQSSNDKELKKVCQEFEGILLSMMYKSMKATVQRSELIPRGAGMDIFETMLDEELVKEASENSSLGLADALYKQVKAAYNTEGGGD